MPHQDCVPDLPDLAPALAELFKGLLPGNVFGSLSFRRDARLSPRELALLALTWMWSEPAALTDRFAAARTIVSRLLDRQQELQLSYQAFLKLLQRWGTVLLFALLVRFQNIIRQQLSHAFQIAGFVVFGVDGSRIDLPRTAAQQAAFTAKYRQRRRKLRGRRRSSAQKKVAGPQLWLTMLWHAGTALPWWWQTGPADASERDHLRKMLDTLPENSLITADAGFVGYDLWKLLLDQGQQFVIRVGSNVRLLRKLSFVREREDLVYLWPQRASVGHQPPLVLRLVRVHNGRAPICLVTSVLSPRQLSDRQLIEIYQRRWGTEVFYRSLKQTFGRRKLRSCCPRNALIELDWSLLALLAGLLQAKCRQAAAGVDLLRTSVAGMLRVIRRALRSCERLGRGFCLSEQLAAALIDQYHRARKSSRSYPRKKWEPPPGVPIIHTATAQQIQQARQFQRPIKG